MTNNLQRFPSSHIWLYFQGREGRKGEGKEKKRGREQGKGEERERDRSLPIFTLAFLVHSYGAIDS